MLRKFVMHLYEYDTFAMHIWWCSMHRKHVQLGQDLEINNLCGWYQIRSTAIFKDAEQLPLAQKTSRSRSLSSICITTQQIFYSFSSEDRAAPLASCFIHTILLDGIKSYAGASASARWVVLDDAVSILHIKIKCKNFYVSKCTTPLCTSLQFIVFVMQVQLQCTVTVQTNENQDVCKRKRVWALLRSWFFMLCVALYMESNRLILKQKVCYFHTYRTSVLLLLSSSTLCAC